MFRKWPLSGVPSGSNHEATTGAPVNVLEYIQRFLAYLRRISM